MGFLAFNPASTFSITGGDDLVMAHASVTTLLAAAGAGIGGQMCLLSNCLAQSVWPMVLV